MANGQSADFQRLIERRRKFIDGLDANRGEINLDIFEDFYPDKAHFVYELLQNAEDAGAKAITFTLMQDKLICEHDGRPFTIEDVTSITGLHDSTKAKAQDKIGKFGVGFKSVFVYTKAPAIYSNDFAFRIVELILPEPLTPDASLGQKTRFEFPFDSPKKPAVDAYAEIAEGLDELDEKTLLFLSNLQSVRWCIGSNTTGEILRIQHSDFHFEVLKELGGKTTSSSHFLKFDEVVQGLGQQRVAVAFPLDVLPGVAPFDEKKPLSDQFKIVPASPGSVAVFFPAAKEASGLRFHLHGPFVPELSRASIKDTSANLPLFEQLAALAAYALHGIKELGLLTTEFLTVLPNPQDQIPDRYDGIRTAIVEEMNTEPLTPMYGGGHAPANRLLQARASLKTLLSEEDIEFLVDSDNEPPLWAVGAAQRNSRIDNFLSGLDIRDWGLEEFIDVLSDKLDDQPLYHYVPDDDYLDWLGQKAPEWMQEFYALLNAEAREEDHRLNTLRIVRLNDGKLSRADSAFFAAESTISSLSAVDKAVYSSGTSKRQQEDAKALLALIGVREVGEAEEIEIILKSHYTEEAKVPPDDVYLDDLRRFVSLVEKQPEKAKLFTGFYVLQGEDELWYTPGGIYLDEPFMDTGLSVYFDAVPEDEKKTALHARYRDCGVDAERIGKFAKAVGAKFHLGIAKDSTIKHNRNFSYLIGVGGSRASSVINRDYYIPHLAELLESPSLELSRLIWQTLLASARQPYSECLLATYQLNRANGARQAPSRLIHDLRAAEWIPQGDDVFVRPADASRELLPEGFPFDPGYAFVKSIQFGETAVKETAQAAQQEATAKSVGFSDAAALERARRIMELMSEEEQEAFISERENSRNLAAVPDRPLANPGRRAENIRDQAADAKGKESEIRPRSVSIGRENVKEQATSFLREHYRNANGDMTCQICKGPLPFNMDDGEGHFETVEFLPELKKRHPQNYVALCPNHSAMFRLVNHSLETMREEFQAIEGNELSVVLAEQDLTIYFSRHHIIDLQAVLAVEAEISGDEGTDDDDDLRAANE